MKDSVAFTKVKKRLRESPVIMELSADSESLPVTVRKSKKVKKEKYKLYDLEGVNGLQDGHNAKHHRHRCHRHNHHRHGHGHSSKMKEERVLKQTCSKYKMALEAVKVKEEPLDEDNASIRQPHSSHTRLERKRATSEDGRDDHMVR
jgi:hypothetical protein